MTVLGFKIYNDPYFIKTYHYHKCNIRDYFNKAPIQRPLMFVIPFMNPKNQQCIYPMNMWCGNAKTSFSNYFNNELNFFDNKDMDNICGVLDYAFKNNYNFSIPKTNIHAINLTYLFDKYVKAYNDEEDNSTKKIIGMMQGSFKALSDCGLKLDNMKKLSLFSNKMLEVFSSSQISIHTQPGHSDYINLIDKKNVHKIVSGPVIHKFMVDNSRKNKKITISENILNIGAHMFRQGWFDIIDNKRILIISKHYNLIKKQIEKEEGNENKYYKRSIFKNCSYEYMDIPELQDSDDDFVSVVNRYIKEFGEKIQKKSYDIVFIGDTPYDIFILNYLQTIGKSGIIGGKFLPLWYGLYTKEDLKTNCDIIKMYMDKNWKLISV